MDGPGEGPEGICGMSYRTWWIRTFHLHRKSKVEDVIPGHVIIQSMIIKKARAANAGRKETRQ